MTLPRLRAMWLMLRGHMVKPDPTVPPVDRPESEEDWREDAICAEEGLYSQAADCIIAATGNGEARVVEVDG